MSRNTWQETLVVQEAAGTLFNTYTAVKSVINPQALWVMPAGYLDIGKEFRITVFGGISNIVTTPGLIDFQVKLGSVAIFDTGNIQLNATAHTTLPFWMEIELTCQAIGSGTNGKFMGISTLSGRMFTLTAGQTDDAQGMQTILAPATAPAQGTGFDSTVANILDFWAGFTISNAGNGIQIQKYKVESLN
jgi:hypothetical protein